MAETLVYATEQDTAPDAGYYEAAIHNPSADELALFAETGRTYQEAARDAYAMLLDSDVRYSDPADRTLPQSHRAAHNKMQLLYNEQYTAPAAAEVTQFEGSEAGVVMNAISVARGKAADLLPQYVNDSAALRRWQDWVKGMDAARQYVLNHDSHYVANRRRAA